MARVKKLGLLIVLTPALLCACGQTEKNEAPIAPDESTPSKPDPAPTPPRVPVPRLEAYGTLMFKAEDGQVRTSACLNIDEIPAHGDYDGAEPAFNALIKAFKAKDEKAYNALTVAEQSGVGTKCPYKMKEFFAEFEGVTLQRIDHVYAFDNLVLVDAVFRMPERDVTFAYAFERTTEGKLAFAPCSERTPFYAAVRAWLSDPRAGDEFNPRCPADEVERATHRVPFGPDPARAGALLLRGASFDEPGELGTTATRVTAALKAIERAMVANNVRGLQKLMGTRGAAKIEEYWRTASAKERTAYADALKGVEPFFIFDASPLVVAYVRQRDQIQVMYFVPASDGRLVWTNSALFTEDDGLFKRGPLSESASLPTPFSNYRIKAP